jgi:predicted nucleic acid-binding protein
MVKALFDTCILIDYLRGIDAAKAEIERQQAPSISIITWMEVMVGATPDTETQLRNFLNRFELIEIDAGIAEQAVQIRKQRKLKLPDAIIQASAEVGRLLLVTRNTKDFGPDIDYFRVPYEI